MSAAVWRINAIDTGGRDLELSELRLWGAAAAVDAGAVLTCSHAPMSGSLANLTDGNPATTCRWAAVVAQSAGFWLQWQLPTAQDAQCARFSGPAQRGFIFNYNLGWANAGRWLWAAQGRVVWPGAGVLSAPRQNSSVFDRPESAEIAVGNSANAFSFLGASADLSTIVALVQGSETSSISLSKDGGATWLNSVPGAVTGNRGFGAVAVSADGVHIVVCGHGYDNAHGVDISHDGGATWTRAVGPARGFYGFGGCAISSNGNTIAVAAKGDAAYPIYISKDGGATWSSPTTYRLGNESPGGGCLMSANGSIIVFFSTYSANLLVSRNGGTSWATETTGLGTDTGYRSGAMSPDGEHLMLASANIGARVVVRRGASAAWTVAAPLGVLSTLLGCAMSADGSVLLATQSAACVSRDGGATWTRLGGAFAGPTYYGCAVSSDGGAAVAATSALGTRIVMGVFRDPSYSENPVRTMGAQSITFVKPGVMPPFAMRAVAAINFKDTAFAGTGRVWGTNKIETAPNVWVPCGGRVVLMHSRSKLLVRETWADPVTGAWEFKFIDAQPEYLVLAEDPEGNYRPVAANKLTAEVMA